MISFFMRVKKTAQALVLVVVFALCLHAQAEAQSFGTDVVGYIAHMQAIAQEHDLPRKNLENLHFLFAQDKLSLVTCQLVADAFKEIADCYSYQEPSHNAHNPRTEMRNMLLLAKMKLKQSLAHQAITLNIMAQSNKENKIAERVATKIPAVTGQDETVAGNLANWGSTTIETGLVINNNNGGTVAAPALQIASFTANPALLVTTTAAQNIAELLTDVTQPGLSIANTSGTFATAPVGTRVLVNGTTVHASTTNVVLTVTGNASNPALLSIGNSTMTAPALQLLNNPATSNTDFALTIDASGNVKQSSATLQNQFILNGGQPGPLTVGTTNATAFSVLTNNTNRLSFDQNGNTIITGSVGIGTSAPITQLQVVQNNPVLSGALSSGSNLRTLYVQGRYVYMINQSSNTLSVFDASNPTAPVLLSTVSTVGSTPDSLYVQGMYAYVVNFGSNTLVVFDISNPSAPVVVNGSGTSTGSSGPSFIYVQGRYAYVTHKNGTLFQVIDVANPASPVIVGSATVTAGLYSLYVQGRYAYVVNYTASNLQVFDISNPTTPVLVNTPTSNPTGTNPNNVYVQGRYAYVVNLGSNSLQIFDIYNPAAPQLVNTGGTTTASAPFMVVVQGRYAYITNANSNSLQLFDVSNPASPISVGSVNTGGGTGPQGVCVQGRYAYIASSVTSTLQIVDLGGAYIQQLEAGGMEVGTLATRENMTVNNDIDIKGGATIGKTLNVSENIGVYAGGNQNAIVAANGTPSTPAYSFINTNTSTGMYSPATNQLALATYGQARLNIDATGSVTEKSNYKIHVYRNSTQTVGVTTPVTVLFNSVVLDPTGSYSATTGGYTAPVTGIYLVSATVSFNISSATTAADVTATRQLNIAVGGTARTGYSCSQTPGYTTGATGSTAGAATPYSLKTTGLLQLTANQVLTITYTTSITADSINANNTHLTVHFLSF